MDYKKLLIINLAFLIVYGKVLKYVFEKMQKGMKRINIEEYPGVKEMLVSGEGNNLNFNYRTLDFEELKQFYDNFTNPKSYTGNYISIIQSNGNNSQFILDKIQQINFYCDKVKNYKIKIFLFSILLIIVVNLIITRKPFSWEKIQKLKEKVRNILKKLNRDFDHHTSTPSSNNKYTNADLQNKKLN